MRLFDFMVFYPMTSFRERKVKGWTSQTSLRRATSLAAISSSIILLAILELVFFLILRVNILDIKYSIFLFFAGGILIIWLFNYIYIKRKRYEYIISSQYRPFKLGTTTGVILCFLIFILSFLLAAAIGVIQGNLLDKYK